MILYKIHSTDAGEALECLFCHSISHNVNDVRNCYCAHCNLFLRDHVIMASLFFIEAVAKLRPDLPLDQQKALVESLLEQCSPEIAPRQVDPQWSENFKPKLM